MTPTHIFIFTLGPVQSFIAQARKTQDLFAGSQLLSDLIAEGIKATLTRNGKIIFPYVENFEKLGRLRSLPNRFLAEIHKPKSELKVFGEDIERQVKSEFETIAKKTFSNIETAEGIKLDRELIHQTLWEKYQRQISQHLAIHWLFLPFTENEYPEKFEEINQLLGAIKNLRRFEPHEETGRKCSVDGERNALFYRKTVNQNIPNYLYDAIEINGKDLGPGEALSAVSMVKRRYTPEDQSGQRFPSTAGIALMASLKEVNEEVCHRFEEVFDQTKISKILNKRGNIKLNGGNWATWDEQFYYEENLNSKFIPNSSQLEIAQECHREVRNAFAAAKQKFTKHYALIAFDADSMGEWLSGKYLAERSNLRGFQTELSGKLMAFGQWASGFLNGSLEDQQIEKELTSENQDEKKKEKEEFYKKQKGRTVYAGGDDFLGFVNVAYLLPTLEKLRDKFREMVSEPMQKYTRYNTPLTFTAAVVIAHYKRRSKP
ncbi:MAG: hypothetical protein HC880_04600 [Bacteroidia bacterium]|nr:hypothetical protein [Bacteroidia bacterium]